MNLKRKDISPRHLKRKYSDADIERMEKLRAQGVDWDEIGKIFGVGGRAIENQLYERGGFESSKPLVAPDFSGWDFSDQNV